MAALDDQQSISSYADDFADDEESVTLQAADTAPPPSNSLETSCDSSRSTRSGDFRAENQDATPSPDDSVPVATATNGPAADAPVPDAPVAGASPATPSDSSEKEEGRGAARTRSSVDENVDQRRLDNLEDTPTGDHNGNNNNNNNSGDEAVSEFSSQAQQPSLGDKEDDDMVSVGDGGGGAVPHEDDATFPPSVRGRLEERLRAAEAENDELRLAAAGNNSGGKPGK